MKIIIDLDTTNSKAAIIQVSSDGTQSTSLVPGQTGEIALATDQLSQAAAGGMSGGAAPVFDNNGMLQNQNDQALHTTNMEIMHLQGTDAGAAKEQPAVNTETVIETGNTLQFDRNYAFNAGAFAGNGTKH